MTSTAGGTGHRPSVRPQRGDLVRGAAGLLAGILGLAVADALLEGLTIDGIAPLVLAALALGVAGWLLRPLLVAAAPVLGWPGAVLLALPGAVLLALLGQAVVVFVALTIVPGVALASFWPAFWASWIVVDRPTGRVFVAELRCRRHRGGSLRRARPAGRRRRVGEQSLHRRRAGGLRDDERRRQGGALTRGRPAFNRFVPRPEGLARGLSGTVSEAVRERFQARRQVRQDMRPRVHHRWGFAGGRSALDGVPRDFNTITVAEAMLRGVRSVYVDYVDYDAMAHHAGIMRPESLDALVGLDRVLGSSRRSRPWPPARTGSWSSPTTASRRDEVSADRYGEDLATLVGRLAGTEVAGSTANTEGSA